jgi:RNA polymerase sigma factor (sigma-70 family)
MTSTASSDEFLSVLDRHKGIIHKIANAYARDAVNRADLTQEIVLQLWKSFENYDPQFRHSTWIYKVALNVSLAFSRKEHNRTKRFGPLREDLVHLVPVALETPGEPTDLETNFRQLQRFIQELKPLDRAILLLYLDEKNHREMAGIIGTTETNISTRINRIKTTLKQKFSQLEP